MNPKRPGLDCNICERAEAPDRFKSRRRMICLWGDVYTGSRWQDVPIAWATAMQVQVVMGIEQDDQGPCGPLEYLVEYVQLPAHRPSDLVMASPMPGKVGLQE